MGQQHEGIQQQTTSKEEDLLFMGDSGMTKEDAEAFNGCISLKDANNDSNRDLRFHGFLSTLWKATFLLEKPGLSLPERSTYLLC